jgi:hypothetical protein
MTETIPTRPFDDMEALATSVLKRSSKSAASALFPPTSPTNSARLSLCQYRARIAGHDSRSRRRAARSPVRSPCRTCRSEPRPRPNPTCRRSLPDQRVAFLGLSARGDPQDPACAPKEPALYEACLNMAVRGEPAAPASAFCLLGSRPRACRWRLFAQPTSRFKSGLSFQSLLRGPEYAAPHGQFGA